MSASGLCASDTNASMPWVSASRPVAALSHSGIVISSRGSVIEMSGTSARPMIVIFTEPVGVGDDAELRDVGAGARRARDHQQRRDRLGDQVDAAVVQDPAAVAGQDRDALGRVDARAAAERDEHVAALLDVPLVGGVDLVVLGVRGDVGPDHRRAAGPRGGSRASSSHQPASMIPGSVTTIGRRAPSRAAEKPASPSDPRPKTTSGAWNLTSGRTGRLRRLGLVRRAGSAGRARRSTARRLPSGRPQTTRGSRSPEAPVRGRPAVPAP